MYPKVVQNATLTERYQVRQGVTEEATTKETNGGEKLIRLFCRRLFCRSIIPASFVVASSVTPPLM